MKCLKKYPRNFIRRDKKIISLLITLQLVLKFSTFLSQNHQKLLINILASTSSPGSRDESFENAKIQHYAKIIHMRIPHRRKMKMKSRFSASASAWHKFYIILKANAKKFMFLHVIICSAIQLCNFTLNLLRNATAWMEKRFNALIILFSLPTIVFHRRAWRWSKFMCWAINFSNSTPKDTEKKLLGKYLKFVAINFLFNLAIYEICIVAVLRK